jgi:hypothetical protein
VLLLLLLLLLSHQAAAIVLEARQQGSWSTCLHFHPILTVVNAVATVLLQLLLLLLCLVRLLLLCQTLRQQGSWSLRGWSAAWQQNGQLVMQQRKPIWLAGETAAGFNLVFSITLALKA